MRIPGLAAAESDFHFAGLARRQGARNGRFDRADGFARGDGFAREHGAGGHGGRFGQETDEIHFGQNVLFVVGGVDAQGAELAPVLEFRERLAEVEADGLRFGALNVKLHGFIAAVAVGDKKLPLGLGTGLADAKLEEPIDG